ncbi:MAG: hypothetical protein WCP72_09635 [Desulfomonile sp.]
MRAKIALFARWEQERIFTAIIVKVVKLFDLNTSQVHHDTTSHTVYGDYELYDDPDHGHPFAGHIVAIAYFNPHPRARADIWSGRGYPAYLGSPETPNMLI